LEFLQNCLNDRQPQADQCFWRNLLLLLRPPLIGAEHSLHSQLIATSAFDRQQSSSCRCSVQMNAWLLFLPGWLAISIARLHLLQSRWSAHEALSVVLRLMEERHTAS